MRIGSTYVWEVGGPRSSSQEAGDRFHVCVGGWPPAGMLDPKTQSVPRMCGRLVPPRGETGEQDIGSTYVWEVGSAHGLRSLTPHRFHVCVGGWTQPLL